jgi:FkbM family methyltransferase
MMQNSQRVLSPRNLIFVVIFLVVVWMFIAAPQWFGSSNKRCTGNGSGSGTSENPLDVTVPPSEYFKHVQANAPTTSATTPTQSDPWIAMLNTSYEDNEVVSVDILRTATSPAFLLALDSSQREGTVEGLTIRDKIFAPMETTIFHHVLKGRCGQKNAQGLAPLVVDVGANLGYFTNFAAALGCRVYSFEPLPLINRMLKTSVALNGFQNQVKLFENVVSDVNKEVYMKVVNRNWAFSHVVDHNESTIVRQAVRLSDVVKEDVLLLKVDVEGFEHEVMDGARALVDSFNVENMVVETKRNHDTTRKVRFINDMQEKKGFHIFTYQEKYGGVDRKLLENWPLSNINRKKLTSHVTEELWFEWEDLWYTKDTTVKET